MNRMLFRIGLALAGAVAAMATVTAAAQLNGLLLLGRAPGWAAAVQALSRSGGLFLMSLVAGGLGAACFPVAADGVGDKARHRLRLVISGVLWSLFPALLCWLVTGSLLSFPIGISIGFGLAGAGRLLVRRGGGGRV